MHNPLSDLDNIKADEQLKHRTLQAVMHKKAKRSPSLWLLMSALACVVLVFVYQQIPSKLPPSIATKDIYAYVSIDINPSMEFQLDKHDKIIDIITYNEDASSILKQEDLKGKTIREAIDWLISNEAILDYMKDGYMQVGVYSEDSTYSTTLEQEIHTTLANVYENNQYGCSNISKEEHQIASEHHISFGKYQLISLLIEYDASYQIEDLQNKSMRELKTLYEELSGDSFQGGNQQGNCHRKGKNHE